MVTAPETPIDRSNRPALAVRGLASVAVLAAVVLFGFITKYGFFGDELYFLAAGRRLAVSYADQGPARPAIAALMNWIAPGSLVALRVPPALITIGAIVGTALLAREFGGGRGAQVLAAAGYATSPLRRSCCWLSSCSAAVPITWQACSAC